VREILSAIWKRDEVQCEQVRYSREQVRYNEEQRLRTLPGIGFLAMRYDEEQRNVFRGTPTSRVER